MYLVMDPQYQSYVVPGAPHIRLEMFQIIYIYKLEYVDMGVSGTKYFQMLGQYIINLLVLDMKMFENVVIRQFRSSE